MQSFEQPLLNLSVITNIDKYRHRYYTFKSMKSKKHKRSKTWRCAYISAKKLNKKANLNSSNLSIFTRLRVDQYELHCRRYAANKNTFRNEMVELNRFQIYSYSDTSERFVERFARPSQYVVQRHFATKLRTCKIKTKCFFKMQM